MPRLAIAVFVAALAVLLALSCASSKSDEPSSPKLSGSRPNIIFIFSDDHAPHAISAYGSKINKTPNIDRLAREGALFRNTFCGNSICGPSRATILSGKHTHANGFMRNGNRFDPSQVTFPKLMQKAGYETAMIGKWHLSSDPQGFDHWMVLPGQGQYYNPDFLTPEGKVRLEGYCTDLTTELGLKWLREQRDPAKPFVLMCQHKAPHRSWMPGPEELSKYAGVTFAEPATLFDDYAGRGPATKRQEMEIDRHMYLYYDCKLEPSAEAAKNLKGPDRWWDGVLNRMNPEQRKTWDATYAAENAAFDKAKLTGKDLVRWKYQRYMRNYLSCVAGVDKSVGQILDYVDSDPELRDNTIVIYSSDQGFYLGDHGWYDKRWMYEESMRMPFLVRWPGKVKAGKEVKALAQNIDFGPTFLDLAGIEVPNDVHGTSLVPLLEGDKPDNWRDALYYHYYESHAVHMVPAHYGVRTDRYKLINFYEPENGYWELYDLETDPDELNNLAEDPAYAEIRESLARRLIELRSQYGDETGDLGNGAFDVTAGLAFAKISKLGWKIQANTSGAYALKTCTARTGQMTFSTKIRTLDPKKPGDGKIIITGGKPRAGLFRAGLDFKNQKLVIQVGMKQVKSVKLSIDLLQATPIEVRVDTQEQSITVTALGKSLTHALPPEWQGITAVGYGCGNTTTEFSAIKSK